MMNRILPYGVTQDKCIKFQMVTELHLQLCFPRWTYQVLISLSLLQSCHHYQAHNNHLVAPHVEEQDVVYIQDVIT